MALIATALSMHPRVMKKTVLALVILATISAIGILHLKRFQEPFTLYGTNMDHPKSEPTTDDAAPTKPSLAATIICTHEERLRHMRETCARLSPRNRGGKAKVTNGLVIDRNRMMYCFNLKASSTTWKTLLVKDSPNWHGEPVSAPHKKEFVARYGIRPLRTLPERERTRVLDSYYKFTVVRHPYERLVSGWRNKLTTHNNDFKYLQQRILQKYRKSTSNHSIDPKYAEFPTFGEFVEYLKDERDIEVHWKSVSDRCDPCHVTWDAIVRTETSDHDSRAVIAKLTNRSRALPFMHKMDENASVQTEKDLTEHYSNVSPQAFAFIKRLYQDDMAILGYGWDPKGYKTSCRIRLPGGGYCC